MNYQSQASGSAQNDGKRRKIALIASVAAGVVAVICIALIILLPRLLKDDKTGVADTTEEDQGKYDTC